MHSIPSAMSDDDDRTQVRRDQNHADPTSWNGISYDDMMRSLEDALPADDRTTLVGQLPTRPVGFQPAPITQRMVNQRTTQPMPQPRPVQPVQTTSVAPVAVPSIAVRYADLDGDYDLDVDAGKRTHETTPKGANRSRRARKSGVLIGAFIGVLALGAFVWTNPQGRATAATGDARAYMGSWITNVTAKTSQHSTAAAATPIAAAPVAPPIAAQPVATPPIAMDPPAIPTMRSPAPPPARPVSKPKAHNGEAHDDANVPEADPASLLDRGLGQ